MNLSYKMCKKSMFLAKFVLFLSIITTANANSLEALRSLTQEHKGVNEIHASQLRAFVNQKTLIGSILLDTWNYSFEFHRLNRLVFNFFVIKNEKE